MAIRPTHTVNHVREEENNKNKTWIKVGVAWEHGDNKGYSITFQLPSSMIIPHGYRLVMREIEYTEAEESTAEQEVPL